MKTKTYGFIGLGLIGGSIARALRLTQAGCRIIAYDPDAASALLAQQEGIADTVCYRLDAAFGECDYLFLCAPVSYNNRNLSLLKDYLRPCCLITDVGSVKTPMHEYVETLGLGAQFIGGHPMAGSERIGYRNSKAGLLENAYYILTPTAAVSAELVAGYEELVRTMGAIPLVMSCREHDYVTAAVSHLPHVAASSLVNLVESSDTGNQMMKLIAAGGFKDITRIASASPDMWQHICLNNGVNIGVMLDGYIEALQDISQKIKRADRDGLYTFFENARRYRDSFMEISAGPIKKSHVLNVDIPDKTGALAAIAGLLAGNGISIKNIGIVHNREQEEGVLRIELYEDETVSRAEKLLSGAGYSSYIKK